MGFRNPVASPGERIDQVIGSVFDDSINHRDSTRDLTIKSLEGNDHIISGSGNDRIYSSDLQDINGTTTRDGTYEDMDFVDAGAGDDYVQTGPGSDSVNGNAGNDTIYGEGGPDYLTGWTGRDTIYGGEGNDKIYGGVDFLGRDTDTNYLNGGPGDDQIVGANGRDSISGDEDNDALYGLDGNDAISGGPGDDLYKGGNGDDYLIDEAGSDVFYGGAGADFYNFFKAAHNDGVQDVNRIKDFEPGVDEIQILLEDWQSMKNVPDILGDMGPSTMITFNTGDQLLIEGFTPLEIAQDLAIV